MTQIAVVGSLNLDTTVRVPRLPRPGETVLGNGHFLDSGGKGANQAVAASRLGRRVAMVGMVGADDAGRSLVAGLEAESIDVGAVVVSEEVGSGMAVITVDEEGENSIVVDPAANGRFTAEALDRHRDVVAGAEVVLLQLEIPIETVAAAVGAARGTVVLNPAPAAPLDGAVLERVDVLVPNATELAMLADGSPPADPSTAIDLARALSGPRRMVVTLGALGAVFVDGPDAEHIAAPQVTAVDPTAAGDAFCGGLADALVGGATLGDAVRWAVACGAVAATRWGAQSSLPTRTEVEELGARR